MTGIEHEVLLARVMAVEAVLLKSKVTSGRELRLAQQRAARKLRRQREETADWVRRQQG